jgi:hypothetical protein
MATRSMDGTRRLTTNGRHGSPVIPFLLGTAVGGLAGAIAGTLLSGQAAHLVTLVLDVVDRRDGQDRGRPNFEWMVQ